MRALDLVGQRFGRLEVLERRGSSPSKGSSRWLCRCDCGNKKLIDAPNLKSGSTSSCGCYRNEQIKKANNRHGFSKHPAYRNLMSAINRCRHRPEYTERGIAVSKLWLGPKGVVRFISEMGSSYFPHAILDRIDNDRGYEPGNCRWTTAAVNQANTKDGRTPEEVRAIRKDTRYRKDIAAQYGCSIGVVARIQKGESYASIN